MMVYNRYVPHDQGAYARIPHDPPPPVQDAPSPPPPPQDPPPPTGGKRPFSLGQTGDGIHDLLRSALDKIHLQDIDTGDLILLGLLFFLFREDADEELLFALGLLLIL